jgi:hypothetical protein
MSRAASAAADMRFAKIVFLIAGIYGFLVLTPIFFMERLIGQQTPPAITHPEYFYGFLGTALVWQVLFLVLSTDPVRYRAMIPVCILEKLAYAVPIAILYAQHRVAASTFAVGSMDWIFVCLFLAAFFKAKPHPPAA